MRTPRQCPRWISALLGAVISFSALASDVGAPVATAKQTFALVAAVGDQFTYVRQRESVGSSIIDNNIRRVIKIPNNALNISVLRGLDATMAKAHPGSERILIALRGAKMEGVLPQNREAVALGKIVDELAKRPERAQWDKIIVATPNYVQSERAGMGPKLQGLGVYVQPLTGSALEGNEGEPDIDVRSQGESDTTNPTDGRKNASKVYVAPYSYIQIYVLDAKTLKVIEKVARHDYQKLNDPNSTALDIGDSITLGTLSRRLVALAERSAARAVSQTEIGVSVHIDEIKPTGNAPVMPR